MRNRLNELYELKYLMFWSATGIMLWKAVDPLADREVKKLGVQSHRSISIFEIIMCSKILSIWGVESMNTQRNIMRFCSNNEVVMRESEMVEPLMKMISKCSADNGSAETWVISAREIAWCLPFPLKIENPCLSARQRCRYVCALMLVHTRRKLFELSSRGPKLLRSDGLNWSTTDSTSWTDMWRVASRTTNAIRADNVVSKHMKQ